MKMKEIILIKEYIEIIRSDIIIIKYALDLIAKINLLLYKLNYIFSKFSNFDKNYIFLLVNNNSIFIIFNYIFFYIK